MDYIGQPQRGGSAVWGKGERGKMLTTHLNHLLTSRVRQTVKPYIERKISKSDAPYNMTFKCVTAYTSFSLFTFFPLGGDKKDRACILNTTWLNEKNV